MQEPKISVVVPVYNTEKELPVCVDSLLDQSFEDFEIILVDDGSTDSGGKICDEYEKRDSRVRVIHKANGGLSDARNTGLLASSGRYILFVDSDDFLSRDALRQMYRGAKEGADIISGCFINWLGEECHPKLSTFFDDGKVISSSDFIIRSIENHAFWVMVWSYMYSREFLIKNGLLFKTDIYYEDMEFTPRALLAASQVVYIAYPFYNHVFRSGSIMSSPNTWKKTKDTLDILKAWKVEFDAVEDKKLRKYLYRELVSAYFSSLMGRGIRGWWIDGFRFPFAFSHSPGRRGKARVIRFEVLSIWAAFGGPGVTPRQGIGKLKEYADSHD